MKTEITEILGIEYPIIQGGMAWVAEHKLAAAVSNAGGLGLIGAASAPADWVRDQVRKAKELTDKPFGVNIMLMSPYADDVAKVIVEEGIRGQEVECAVLGNRDAQASIVGEIGASAQFYDYDDKYVNGTSQLYIPARLDEEVAEKIRRTAVRAYRLLGCSGLTRVDFFVTEGDHRVVLNELNTLPGFTSISMYPKLWMAMGLTYGELLDKLIDLAFQKAGQERP